MHTTLISISSKSLPSHMFSDPYIPLSSSVGQKTFHHSAPLVFWYSFSLHWAYRSISQYSNFILVGDFDVDVSNHLHPKVSTLPDLFYLSQFGSGHTHESCSLLDLVLTTNPNVLQNCSVISSTLCWHCVEHKRFTYSIEELCQHNRLILSY